MILFDQRTCPKCQRKTLQRSEKFYSILAIVLPFVVVLLLLFGENSSYYFTFWFQMVLIFVLMGGLCYIAWGELIQKKLSYVCIECGYREVLTRKKLSGFAEIGLLSAAITFFLALMLICLAIVS
ncbi:MAG: hypothetical protein CO029_00365 [Candidatus Magasanikbacteria bacterium CG_4_9_14_0_2_um_filter_41_10]|nr:MAG: hypothetical protein CO029_00365 [Candidatus Magasanikbacteria bacterium CG_4_9_14_0_2_um_filter_41_10]